MELLFARERNPVARKDVGDGHTERDAEDDECCIEDVAEGTHEILEVVAEMDKTKDAAIHQDARYHGDDARNRDDVVGGARMSHKVDCDQRDERCPRQ